jgi:GxxExxY protein
MEEGNYLYKNLSYGLVGICMEIHREYGCIHNERIYHKVLIEKLNKNKIKNVSKPKIVIFSKETGNEIGYYEPDLIVEDKIIIELKATPVIFKKHEIQLSEYIKTSIYELGYLVNFGLQSLYFKRIIYTNNNKLFLSKIK